MLQFGVIYFARLHEFLTGRTSSSDVLSYLAPLHFLEHAPKTSTRRLQILLTQGSVHRHFARQEELEWVIYQQHLDDAFDCYTRALKSAQSQDHLLHTLNAVSYMMLFCLKALRFGDDETARSHIIERSREALSYAD